MAGEKTQGSRGRSKPAQGHLSRVRAQRRQFEKDNPLEVRVSLAFRFGEETDDRVLMLDDRPIPMVGSVFHYRDRIARSFAMLLLRAGVSQPKVLAELLPAMRWATARRKAEQDD